MVPSFSMVHALENGFNLVLYSCTPNKLMDNDMIHSDDALRLILQKGMCLVFHQNLTYSEGESKLGPKKEALIDLVLFCYVWIESNNY